MARTASCGDEHAAHAQRGYQQAFLGQHDLAVGQGVAALEEFGLIGVIIRPTPPPLTSISGTSIISALPSARLTVVLRVTGLAIGVAS